MRAADRRAHCAASGARSNPADPSSQAYKQRNAKMFAPVHPWLDLERLLGRPNIGSLMGLCEENHAALLRLMPGLRAARGSYRAMRSGHPDLHLDILEQAPYTTSARLTHYFAPADAMSRQPEPDARLRIYHDARQVEMLALHSSAFSFLDPNAWTLPEKWRANLFLAKWLGYCLEQGYAFAAGACPGAVNEVPHETAVSVIECGPRAAMVTGAGGR